MREFLRFDFLETRRTLHRRAYQHRTTRKFKICMLEVLVLLQRAVRIPSKDGRKLTLTRAALETDKLAFLFLKDSYVSTKLLEGSVEADHHPLKQAYMAYRTGIVDRKCYAMVCEHVLDHTEVGNFKKMLKDGENFDQKYVLAFQQNLQNPTCFVQTLENFLLEVLKFEFCCI